MITGSVMTTASQAIAAMPLIQAPDPVIAFQNLMNDASAGDCSNFALPILPAASVPAVSVGSPVISGDNVQAAQHPPVNVLPQIQAEPDAAPVPASDKSSEAEEMDCLDAAGPELRVYASPAAFIAAAPVIAPSIPDARLSRTASSKEPVIAATPETKPKILAQDAPQFPANPAPYPVAVSPTSAVTNAAAPAEMATTAHLDSARDTLWLDQLAREIVAVGSHYGKLRFSLSPPALGDLDVAISTQADGVHVQLQTSTENAARIFAAEQPKLAEELRQSGIRLTGNDMMGSQQMGGHRDQSHMQNSARHVPLRISGQSFFEPTANTATAAPHTSRFA